MAALIEVEGLAYTYEDGTRALNGVDFRLDEGETVALLGANGSGKTTFILHLNGLLTGEGRVVVCGLAPIKENLAEIRRKIGIVFQDSDEQLFMPSVLEDVMFGPLNMGQDPEAASLRAMEVLTEVGMARAAHKAPYHLSAGEKKRVAIAGVLAMHPEILVFDEPTTFLDPPAQRDLARLLRSLPQGKLIVTHDADFATALATRAVFFEHGRIVDEGAVERIIAAHDWKVRF
jgi:cobalt/nickel transport system ATP-binding protein